MSEINKLKFGQLAGINIPQEMPGINLNPPKKTKDEEQEKKVQEIAQMAENSMQELQISEPEEKQSFFDEIKKNLIK